MFHSVMSIFERLKITVYNNRDTGNEILTRNHVFYRNFLHVHFMLSTMSTFWIMFTYRGVASGIFRGRPNYNRPRTSKKRSVQAKAVGSRCLPVFRFLPQAIGIYFVYG